MDKKAFLEQLKAHKADLTAQKAARQAAAGTKVPSAGAKSKELAVSAKFGVKSFNDLIKIDTSKARFKALPSESRAAVLALKEATDVTLMCAMVFKKAPTETEAYHELVVPALKAFGIDSGDQGFAWIPTAVSDSYFDEYNLERRVASLFTEVKMPTNPYIWPVLSNGAIATRLGENSKKSPSDVFTTTSITFTAVKMSNQYELPEELHEDSAVDMMKVIRQELIEGQAKAEEIAILEGDTATTHQHTNTQIPGLSGAPAADSSERFFDGLRKRALAGNLKTDAGADALVEADLSGARSKMGKFGVQPSELAFIASSRVYFQMQDLDDVRTLEQYGPQATVLTGELAKINGIPVIVSEWLREDTDATGVNGATGGNNVKGSLILVNRKRFALGARRPLQIQVTDYRTQFDVTDLVSWQRKAFQGVLSADGSNAAAEKSVSLIYNIGL